LPKRSGNRLAADGVLFPPNCRATGVSMRIFAFASA
jgi:hypothetical protein